MQRDYESMYILRPNLEDEQVDAAVKKLEDFITKNGGSIVRHEKKGKKRLAYEVKDQKDGHYSLINFTLEPSQINELKRFFSLSEETVRYLILRQDEAGPVQPKPAVQPAQPPVEAAV
ncbi:MAG: 30S ribosomal protein S6 [Candidatus Sericytochromatia bacterium]|nr:30S ribosomal protein S6 [Candidatus Tanganyikabacteria bacterium]